MPIWTTDRNYRTGPAIAVLALSVTLGACGGGDGGDSDDERTTFNVSGTITAAAGADIDTDTNDPFSPLLSNNTPGSQTIDNPITVGGYLTRTPTNTGNDRYASTVDVQDEYTAQLVNGQTINLFIADHNPQIDFDLYLYAQGETDPNAFLASSQSQNATESIEVSQPDGTYEISVQAFTGSLGANYVLTIGQQATSVDTSEDFVPGEILVRLHPDKLYAQSQPLTKGGIQAMGMQVVYGAAGETQLLRLGDTAERPLTLSALGVRDVDPARAGYAAMDEEQKLRADTVAAVAALRARADVATADLNYIRRAFLVPNDQFYNLQWHYPQINLPQAWDITTGSTSVVVAVVDTGVFMTHPDLDDNLTTDGYDFISSASNARDGDGIDDNPDDPGDNPTPGFSSFHGTHVAGTIAAESNNGSGIAGTSFQTRIMPLRVLGRFGGNSSDIIQAIRYAAGLSNISGELPGQAADIINLSLGGGGFSATEQAEYTNVRNAGSIIIAAAGNENTSALSYPASYNGVVSVSAVDFNKARAPYSNFGTEVDVAAPGGNTGANVNGDLYADGVLSTVADDAGGSRQPAYSFYQGTSMAAPHMAGVAALMKAVNPALTPSDLDTLLADSLITEDLGAAGRDDIFGHGLIDALKAVQVASDLGMGGLPPRLSLNPSSVSFGGVSTSTDVVASVSGGQGQVLAITGHTDDASWLTVTPASGLVTYTLTVDRSGLSDGVYSATVTFTTTVDGLNPAMVELPVTIRVGDDPDPGNTGFTYVILINPETGDTVDTLAVANVNGRYEFNFADVAPGQYEIVAGTDSDNDNFLCDQGESCGGYPTFSLTELIDVVDDDVTGLDFTVNFDIGFEAAAASGATRPAYRRSDVPLQDKQVTR